MEKVNEMKNLIVKSDFKNLEKKSKVRSEGYKKIQAEAKRRRQLAFLDKKPFRFSEGHTIIGEFYMQGGRAYKKSNIEGKIIYKQVY